MKKYKTWLPVFPGFYGTIFESDGESEMEYINEQRAEKGLEEITDCDVDFDDKTYQNDIAEQCCSILEGELEKLKLVSKITMEEVRSPREYNFANDSINIVVEMDAKNRKAIKTYVYGHKKEFELYLKENYTSRSGFWSSYSDLFSEWEAETGSFYRFDDPAHYLGAVLQFICDCEEITGETLYYLCEANLEVVDIELEVNKIQCPVCKDWYVPETGLKEMYDWQVKKDAELYASVCGGKQPAVKTFEQWGKDQPAFKHCE